MAINVYKGAKFYFDIVFSIPDPFDHENFRIEDVIPAGFSLMDDPDNPGELEVDLIPVTLDDNGIPTVDDNGEVIQDGEVPAFEAIRDTTFVPERDTLRVEKIVPLTAGQAYLLTVAVEVTDQELAAEADLNTAVFYVDDNTEAFDGADAIFKAEKARLSFFGKSSILTAKDGATSALTYELLVLNDHSGLDYTITVNLDEDVQGQDFPFFFGQTLTNTETGNAVYVMGFRKGDDGDTSVLNRGTDFNVTQSGPTLLEITVHTTDNTRGHRLYFALGIQYDNTPAPTAPILSRYDVLATVECAPKDIIDTKAVHLVIIEQPLTVNPKKLVR